MGLGATLVQWDLILTTYSCDDPISKYPDVLGVRTSDLSLWGEEGVHIEPIRPC